jgi:hypothetical protein
MIRAKAVCMGSEANLNDKFIHELIRYIDQLISQSHVRIKTEFTWTLRTSKRFGGASTPSNQSRYELHSLKACVAPKDYKM